MLQEHNEEGVSINLQPKTLNIFESKKESIDASKLGTIYHNIMQRIDFFKDVTKETIEGIISKLNIDDNYKKFVNVNKILTCVDKIKTFNIISVKKELPFLSYLPYNFIFNKATEKDRILIQGVADLIIDNGKETILIDYKTTKAKNPDCLVEQYKVQLQLYKVCLEKALNISISSTYIYSFYFDDFIKIV
jgi:ATP-dependent helicase/nuclease subunit A